MTTPGPSDRTARLVVIEGAALTSLDEAYSALARALPLPDHFGDNLDALFDSLTGDVPGPLDIEWRDSAAARAAIGPAFERLRETMQDAASDREDLTVRFL